MLHLHFSIAAIVATCVACVAASGGLFLAWCVLKRRKPHALVVWGHPLAGLTALTLVYVAVTGWDGSPDLMLDVGALVLTVAFLGGGLLYALRASHVNPPFGVMLVHGALALSACVLLIIGLVAATRTS